MKKIRADVLLAAQGKVESRSKAERYIMLGEVYYLDKGNKVPILKAGQLINQELDLLVTIQDKYVSRGGEKLETALEAFNINVQGLTAFDAGASTGGFTDCLLQNGAAKVYAVDVGYGQLHWKLRQDSRVINIEQTNIRTANSDLINEKVDLVVVDCSFISLKLILPACVQFLKSRGLVIALIKPQFEVGANNTDKGVVRSQEVQLAVVDNIVTFAKETLFLSLRGFVPAKIKGPKGNQEYLAVLDYDI